MIGMEIAPSIGPSCKGIQFADRILKVRVDTNGIHIPLCDSYGQPVLYSIDPRTAVNYWLKFDRQHLTSH